MSDYDESYPPSILGYSMGATAGIPGTWTPSGSNPPATVQDLVSGHWVPVTASPATPWTTGQYVQTATSGAPGRATWTGTAWVGGAAPDPEPPPEEPPEEPPPPPPPDDEEPPPDEEPTTD